MLKRIRYQLLAGLCGAAVVLAIPAAAGATAVKHTSFTGTYTGKATLVVINNGSSGSATLANSKGTGKSSIIGSGSFTQVGKAAAPAFSDSGSSYCSAFSGEAILKGSAGTITLKVSGSTEVCSNKDSGAATATVVKGTAVIVKGTGKAAKLSGTLSFTGATLTTNSSETSGNFKITLKGTLTVK